MMIPDWWVVVDLSVAYHAGRSVAYMGPVPACRCPSHRYSGWVLKMLFAWVVQMPVRFPIPLLGLGPWAVDSLNHHTLGVLFAVDIHPCSMGPVFGSGTLHRLPMGSSDYRTQGQVGIPWVQIVDDSGGIVAFVVPFLPFQSSYGLLSSDPAGGTMPLQLLVGSCFDHCKASCCILEVVCCVVVVV
jgi:hypothetical protein